jgi:hypothetical protein
MDRIENDAYNKYSIVACVFVAEGPCVPSRFIAMDVSSGSAVPIHRRRITVF